MSFQCLHAPRFARSSILSFAVLLVAWFQATSTSAQSPRENTLSNYFVVAPQDRLAVDVDRGNIVLSSTDRNEVTVVVHREVQGGSAAEADRIFEQHHVTISQEGDTISVRARQPRQDAPSLLSDRPNLEVNYWISVPKTFAARLANSGGDFQATGLFGQVEARTAGGNIECTNLAGALDARTSGGNITAEGCAGRARLQSSGGEIKLLTFTGPSVQADTSGGSITAEIDRQPGAECRFHTSGGNLTLSVADKISFSLTARASGGSINSDLPVTTNGPPREGELRGTVSGGGPVILLTTSGGDIRILKR